MKTAERIISVTVAALLLAAFALYAFLCPRADKLSVVLSGITFILIAAVILPNVRSMLAFSVLRLTEPISKRSASVRVRVCTRDSLSQSLRFLCSFLLYL